MLQRKSMSFIDFFMILEYRGSTDFFFNFKQMFFNLHEIWAVNIVFEIVALNGSIG